MVAKNEAKKEALRIRVYNFFEKNKDFGKPYTVEHFTAEQVPRSTVYGILSRLERFPPVRKSGSGHQFKKNDPKKSQPAHQGLQP